MHDAIAKHQSICADHSRNGHSRSNLHRGYSSFFQFSCNRSTAASARTSRRRQNDRVDAKLLCLLRHLPAHPPGV
jgi:hypothetical protein